jgi:hypothetical protein
VGVVPVRASNSSICFSEGSRDRAVAGTRPQKCPALRWTQGEREVGWGVNRGTALDRAQAAIVATRAPPGRGKTTG